MLKKLTKTSINKITLNATKPKKTNLKKCLYVMYVYKYQIT